MTRDTLTAHVTALTRADEAQGSEARTTGEWRARMEECVRIEIDIECGRHSELLEWAERLKTTPEELVKRAVSEWLSEMAENSAK